MSNSHKRPFTMEWFYVLLALLAVVALSLVAFDNRTAAEPINRDLICNDLASIITNPNNPEGYDALFEKAYLVVEEDDGQYEILYKNDKIDAEVWIYTPETHLGDIWICLCYNATDSKCQEYKIYDYGYITT